MGDYTANDPELVKERDVDSDGRIYVGREYANRRFKVILEAIDDE